MGLSPDIGYYVWVSSTDFYQQGKCYLLFELPFSRRFSPVFIRRIFPAKELHTLLSCPSAHLSFGMLVQGAEDGLFSQEVAATWDITLRLRGKFWSQEGRVDRLPWSAGSQYLFCLLSLPDTHCVLCLLPFWSHCLVHPTQSEYFNSPNTGIFSVNTGFCPLPMYSDGHFHEIPGYCSILVEMPRYHDLLTVSWEGNCCRKTVPHPGKTKSSELTPSMKWEISIFFWRPEFTRNVFNSIIRVFMGCS